MSSKPATNLECVAGFLLAERGKAVNSKNAAFARRRALDLLYKFPVFGYKRFRIFQICNNA